MKIPLMAAAQQFFKRSDRQMRFAHAGWRHRTASLFRRPRDAHEQKPWVFILARFSDCGVLRGPHFTVSQIGDAIRKSQCS